MFGHTYLAFRHTHYGRKYWSGHGLTGLSGCYAPACDLTILFCFSPAQLSSIPGNDTVDLCTNVTFSCEGYGIPAPIITWRHNDTQINMMLSVTTATVYHNASNGIAYISSNLSISRVRYQDRGLYMCSIQNEVGNDAVTSVLSINYEGMPNHRLIIILQHV